MRSYSEPTAAAEDEFDMYGLELPLGDWAYVVDDQCVYGPGWYPFHRPVTRTEPLPSAGAFARVSVETGRTRPTGLRLAPDKEFRSWRNEYVLLTPFDHRLHARMRLFVERRGMGAMVRTVTVGIDLRDRSVTLPDACPTHLRRQAEVKGTRVLALVDAARRERRRGLAEPTDIQARPSRDES